MSAINESRLAQRGMNVETFEILLFKQFVAERLKTLCNPRYTNASIKRYSWRVGVGVDSWSC